MTYVKALLGEYDFDSVTRLEPVWGTIIGFVYMLVSLFVLVTVVVAILSSAFDETNEQLEEKRRRLEEKKHMAAKKYIHRSQSFAKEISAVAAMQSRAHLRQGAAAGSSGIGGGEPPRKEEEKR